MRIKKMYQGTIPENKILNMDSNSETDTYSCKKINEKIEEVSNQGSNISVDNIYPVGSIYMSVNETDPNTIFQGTKWERLLDRFLVGAGNLYANGTTGGSKDAVVVEHSHTTSGTAASNGAHTHTTSGTAASNGAHTHTTSGTAASAGSHSHATYGGANVQSSGGSEGVESFGSRYSSFRKIEQGTYAAGDHTHSVTGTAASNGAHTHSVTGTAASNGAHTHNVTGTAASTGVSGTNANLPPYLAVYMWVRTA